MGAVYKAIDTMIEREVAIKMLRPEIARQPSLLQRFRAEAVTVAKINHFRASRCSTTSCNKATTSSCDEYVPGKTWKRWSGNGALPWQIAVPSLEKFWRRPPAHDLGILHRI